MIGCRAVDIQRVTKTTKPFYKRGRLAKEGEREGIGASVGCSRNAAARTSGLSERSRDLKDCGCCLRAIEPNL
jgi:hypothetical protein